MTVVESDTSFEYVDCEIPDGSLGGSFYNELVKERDCYGEQFLKWYTRTHSK